MKMGLDREMIVRSALELLNEIGLDAFTTRRLAERLGVKQPAIYWHFKNKRDLLDEMAAQMLREVGPPGPMTRETWMDALKDNARSFRQSLLRYRDGARVHAGTRPDASLYASLDSRVRAMCEAGFSASDALRSMMVISHYVVGSVIEEQSAAEAARIPIETGFMPDPDAYPDLSHGISLMRDDDRSDGFEFGLDALVRGFAARYVA
ncbi:MAG TPA: TetR/AcrR family transcriptional regulator C-terminal domain-containing protein [Gemmatimonadaceae bacterium]|jgi:TetR/AcrR family tetracycline transcriptional repressor